MAELTHVSGGGPTDLSSESDVEQLADFDLHDFGITPEDPFDHIELTEVASLLDEDDTDSFDSLTRVAIHLLAITTGAAVGVSATIGLGDAMATAIIGIAGASLAEQVVAALMMGTPGPLASIGELLQRRSEKKLAERQRQTQSELATAAALDVSFCVDTDNLIELREFLLFVPALSNFTLGANVTVTDKSGTAVTSFALNDFNPDSPPKALAQRVEHLSAQQLSQSGTDNTPPTASSTPPAQPESDKPTSFTDRAPGQSTPMSKSETTDLQQPSEQPNGQQHQPKQL